MIKILFICHGNICRSTAAQYVMQDMVKRAGLAESFFIDSAATSTEEIGNPVYPPMRRTLESHGVPCEGHRARQMTRRDYDAFDLIIAADDENLYYLNRICGGDPEGKVPSADGLHGPAGHRDLGSLVHTELRAGV